MYAKEVTCKCNDNLANQKSEEKQKRLKNDNKGGPLDIKLELKGNKTEENAI